MIAATRFLRALGKQLSAMRLYHAGHPERERALDETYRALRVLLEGNPNAVFTFLEGDVVYDDRPISELRDWEWAWKLSAVQLERLEFDARITRDQLEGFLEEVDARLLLSDAGSLSTDPTSEGAVRFGAVSVVGERHERRTATATMGLSLEDELEIAGFIHNEADERGEVPQAEAVGVVQLLAAAMHREEDIILPLVELKEIDQYTATHSINVAVLSMGLAESMALPSTDVRAVGEAALLHDVGKTAIPLEILNKPGKLTDEEFKTIQEHPVEGARILLSSGSRFAFAATVAYEHHIGWTGKRGYPEYYYDRQPGRLSRLVQVCDIYDALRTRRPHRGAWPMARALAQLQKEMGEYLDPEFVTAFLSMIRQWEPFVLKQNVPELEPEPAVSG
jgi:putative nucleotidyltransferase with HDIG domain